ncbi:RAN GTPase-activating protein 1 [Diplonema papillatum]|nr:RAN GTPase-activating protein 1 [Diplonema papillatum]
MDGGIGKSVADQRRQFEAKYVTSCLEQGIEPVPEVLQMSADMSSVSLAGKGCGEKGVAALSAALTECSLFRSISIRDSFMGCEGAVALCCALTSCPVGPAELDLTGGNIRSRGTEALADYIRRHALKELRLEWNATGSGIAAFAVLMDAVAGSKSLELLDLRHNHITSEGCQCIASMLHRNSSLRALDLRWNQITPDGSSLLAAAVSHNHTLRSLQLSGNDIEYRELTLIDMGIRNNMQRQATSHPVSPRSVAGSQPGLSLQSPTNKQTPDLQLQQQVFAQNSQASTATPASPDATRRWVRSGAAGALSPDDAARAPKSLTIAGQRSSVSPWQPSQPTKRSIAASPPNACSHSVHDAVKIEMLTQRNLELASQVALMEHKETEIRERNAKLEQLKLDFDNQMDAQQAETNALKTRMKQLEGAKAQVEEMLKSRDVSLKLLREKVLSYQERLEKLLMLSNGRNMDDVVEEMQADCRAQVDKEKAEMVAQVAKQREQWQQQAADEIAMLKHEVGTLHNRLATQSKELDESAQRCKEYDERAMRLRAKLDGVDAQTEQLIQDSEAERRTLLQRLEDVKEALQKSDEASRLACERLAEDRKVNQTEIALRQVEFDKRESAWRSERAEFLQKLTRARQRNDCLVNENTAIQAEMCRMKDDQKSFQHRLELKVHDQVRTLLNNYSTPLQAIDPNRMSTQLSLTLPPKAP